MLAEILDKAFVKLQNQGLIPTKIQIKGVYKMTKTELDELGVGVSKQAKLKSNENIKSDEMDNLTKFIEDVKSKKYLSANEKLEIFFNKLIDVPKLLIDLINIRIIKEFNIRINICMSFSPASYGATKLYLVKYNDENNDYDLSCSASDIINVIKYLNSIKIIKDIKTELKNYEDDNCEK